MKKKVNGRYSPREGISKLLMKMKLLTIFMLVALAATSANSYSQVTRFNLRLNDITVKEVFQQIEENSEFILLYNEKSVDLNRKVSVRAKDDTVESILEQVFKGTGNEWKIYDRQIVVLASGESDVKMAPDFGQGNQSQQPQRKDISGRVLDSRNQPLPGVAVIVKGSTVGTVTDNNGAFQLTIPADAQILEFSFVGMKRMDLPVDGRTVFNVVLEEETIGVDEVVVVGYGTQKRSDITGTVASLGKERLEMMPNLNVAQAIQGAIPGVMIQTSSAGAEQSQAILVRGRNSILASNTPLIVVDGIPYDGDLNSLNPNDVLSIEILKDASAAAIYGSRGSNGVILITTKLGDIGRPLFKYDVKYSVQNPTNVPEVMDGGEYYKFKMDRGPQHMTEHEIKNYQEGKWVDWYDLGLRKGNSHEHNISMTGGAENIRYFISGGILDVKGVALNDDFLRASSRINLDVNLLKWITFGTRTQLTYSDLSGTAADFYEVLRGHPLTTPFDADGNLTIYPWPGNEDLVNPLEQTIWNNSNHRYQVLTNNYANINFPFVPGLTYRINTGIKFSVFDEATYIGRNSTTGLKLNGGSETERDIANNAIVENILSYTREYGMHNLFITGLLSFEQNQFKSTRIYAQGFPHDFLTYYSIGQAEYIEPAYSFNSTKLISQMLRINYSYNSRYLLTLTGRRDGFSGFGSKSKWGFFPSVALGWNISNEDFFTWKETFNVLKLRTSYGLNGNQAVGPYQSISRLQTINIVDGNTTLPGYEPRVLGQDNLSWESSNTLNVGLDFAIKDSRYYGDINLYKTSTYDLLLNRTISGIHGITSITQNIGKTANTGIEFSMNSRNIIKKDFKWVTSFNMAYVKNKIVSLYGELDDEGVEIDDVANAWFIGQPIRVNYDFLWLGTWQLNEEVEAAKYGSKPGYVKLKDVDGDYKINANDRVIIGQRDPKFLWGLNNTFSFKQFSLSMFFHGVHGITKRYDLMTDGGVHNEIRRNTIRKDWWTPDNPTNNFVMNHRDAEYMGGQRGYIYKDASFIRIKDISLAYDVSEFVTKNIGFKKANIFLTGRNLYTITKWLEGLDPELNDQQSIPLQKELVIGLNLEF